MAVMVSHVLKWADGIRQGHAVDPWIFLGLMIVCAPFFYYSLYRLGRATIKKDGGGLNLWGAVFLTSTALPYLYVLAFGRNLPWYIYIVLAALVAQGVWSLLRRRKKNAEVGR